MSLRIPDPVLGPWVKGFPPETHGLRLSELAGAGISLAEFQTPILTLHEAALDHNERVVFAWAQSQGIVLAPHGKTSMAPALWQRLLDAGAWGLTVATPWQAGVAVEAGVDTVLVANSVTDAGAAAHLGALLDADDGLRILCWADSEATVRILASALSSARRPLDILVEMGGAGGRTGARTVSEGQKIAEAIDAAPGLRLAGVAGYEGPFAFDREAESIAAVDAYLQTLVDLHDLLSYPDDLVPLLTAGGSAFPDRAAAVLSHARNPAQIVLRSGAFQIHDDGFYAAISPQGAALGGQPLRSAMHVWSRVISQPEEGLALLDAGRRDVSFDMGLPIPQTVAGEITHLNDQHAFVTLAAGESVEVGDVVRLGLSHPCTVLDRWRVIPLIDDPEAADPRIVGAVATIF